MYGNYQSTLLLEGFTTVIVNGVKAYKNIKTGQIIYDNSVVAGNGIQGSGETVRDTLLDSTSNQKLKNAIDQIYRPGATTGDGGLADAVRHQLSTGELVGGKDHLIKAAERIKNLENIIKKEALSSSDLQLA